MYKEIEKSISFSRSKNLCRILAKVFPLVVTLVNRGHLWPS